MSSIRIPLSDIDYGSDEEAAVLEVLRSQWLSMGPQVETFESALSVTLGVEHAIAVSSGTAALHLALLALDIGQGDEVIQPAINFVAAANATIAAGAEPVFADVIGLSEPTIDPCAVERLITPRTRAVVAMHYGGYPSRLAELCDLCARRGIALIEDACHALGARFLDAQGRPPHGAQAGTVGDVGCFSFFANKNLAIGEGGLAVTNRLEVAERMRRLRSHGMTTLTWDRHRGHAVGYDVVAHGYNYRLDEMHAALGRCQLRKLARNNARRRELVDAYRVAMRELDDWIVPFADHPGENACHLFVVLAPDPQTRARVVRGLREKGIQTSLHYPCVPDFSAFRSAKTSHVDRSRTFASRAITLPLFPNMSSVTVDEVCRELIIASDEEEMSGAVQRTSNPA